MVVVMCVSERFGGYSVVCTVSVVARTTVRIVSVSDVHMYTQAAGARPLCFKHFNDYPVSLNLRRTAH